MVKQLARGHSGVEWQGNAHLSVRHLRSCSPHSVASSLYMLLVPAPLEAYLSRPSIILQVNLPSNIFLAISELVSLFSSKISG